MPVFTPDEAHQFWKSYDGPTVYDTICLMEISETWAVDNDDEISAALKSLGEKMDNMTDISDDFKKQLLPILSQIRISMKLYIMYCLDLIKLRSAEGLILFAEANKDLNGAREFLDRNLMFERLRLSSRMFSNERLTFAQEVGMHET